MSCGVIQPLAQELPYAAGGALKQKQKHHRIDTEILKRKLQITPINPRVNVTQSAEIRQRYEGKKSYHSRDLQDFQRISKFFFFFFFLVAPYFSNSFHKRQKIKLLKIIC